MEAFDTDDRREAEARCHSLGMEIAPPHVKGQLNTYAIRPAVVKHPMTGESTWFNQVHLFELNRHVLGWRPYLEAKLLFLHPVFRTHWGAYGDGSPIEAEVMEHMSRVIDDHTVGIAMDRTDIIVIDNLLCMHGRARFHGRRRILVSMTR
jgi:hypothetical protein